MKARQRLSLPPRTYAYVAVKTQEEKTLKEHFVNLKAMVSGGEGN